MNNYLNLPTRVPKPRKIGLTSIHDVSLTCDQLSSILEDHGEFIDIAKFGVGTAYVTPKLREKVELYKKYNVDVYFGGTLFEKFYYQNAIQDYIKFMKEHEVNMVEVSTGTISLDLKDRLTLVREFVDMGFTVLGEVGTKDANEVMAPSVWFKEINALMEAGCLYVITEGRNSGTAGVFRPSGELRTGLIDDIILNCDVERLIFEAPVPKAQMYFINKVGCNVNLGNINPNDLLLLETQRLGLRSETFYLS